MEDNNAIKMAKLKLESVSKNIGPEVAEADVDTTVYTTCDDIELNLYLMEACTVTYMNKILPLIKPEERSEFITFFLTRMHKMLSSFINDGSPEKYHPEKDLFVDDNNSKLHLIPPMIN